MQTFPFRFQNALHAQASLLSASDKMLDVLCHSRQSYSSHNSPRNRSVNNQLTLFSPILNVCLHFGVKAAQRGKCQQSAERRGNILAEHMWNCALMWFHPFWHSRWPFPGQLKFGPQSCPHLLRSAPDNLCLWMASKVFIGKQ